LACLVYGEWHSSPGTHRSSTSPQQHMCSIWLSCNSWRGLTCKGAYTSSRIFCAPAALHRIAGCHASSDGVWYTPERPQMDAFHAFCMLCDAPVLINVAGYMVANFVQNPASARPSAKLSQVRFETGNQQQTTTSIPAWNS
jgi:hypothetical protein